MLNHSLKSFSHSVFLVAVTALLCGFSVQKSPAAASQPSEERKEQDSLPQSSDEMWKTLGKCKVHLNSKNYTYSIDYTAEVKSMKGKQETVSGFMLPLEPTETFKHFLLSKRTPTCPFCPPGEPNEVVEVFTQKPIKWDEGMIVITGQMEFTNNPQLGLFFQLKDGELMDTKPYEPQGKPPPV